MSKRKSETRRLVVPFLFSEFCFLLLWNKIYNNIIILYCYLFFSVFVQTVSPILPIIYMDTLFVKEMALYGSLYIAIQTRTL